jgi:hypothetical protein
MYCACESFATIETRAIATKIKLSLRITIFSFEQGCLKGYGLLLQGAGQPVFVSVEYHCEVGVAREMRG